MSGTISDSTNENKIREPKLKAQVSSQKASVKGTSSAKPVALNNLNVIHGATNSLGNLLQTLENISSKSKNGENLEVINSNSNSKSELNAKKSAPKMRKTLEGSSSAENWNGLDRVTESKQL